MAIMKFKDGQNNWIDVPVIQGPQGPKGDKGDTGPAGADGSDATVTVDAAMSDTSTNPVQNKVVKSYVDDAVGDIPTVTNDLTNVLKSNYDSAYAHSQSAHAPSNAEANVQSDWNQTNTGADDYIKNKPIIPSPYSLPIASPNVLGGVMPVAKTEAMTQDVGVDANGKLYTAPGGGGSNKKLQLLIDYTVQTGEEASVSFTFTEANYPGISNLNMICFIMVHPSNNANSKWFGLWTGNIEVIPFRFSGGAFAMGVAENKYGYWFYNEEYDSNYYNPRRIAPSFANLANAPSDNPGMKNKEWGEFNTIRLQSYGQFLLVGTRIMIYGA